MKAVPAHPKARYKVASPPTGERPGNARARGRCRTLHAPHMRSFSRSLRRNQTDAELKLWYLVRNRGIGGYKFKRQYSLGPYVADLCCPERKLIIELDGSGHMDHQIYDERRERYMSNLGFRTIRFFDNELILHPLETAEAILRELQQPLTLPSPLKGARV